MPSYPSTYPPPDAPGYSGSKSVGDNRSSVDSARPNTIREYNAAVESVAATFEMDHAQWWPWIVWVDANGFDWFDIDLVSTARPVDVFSTVRARVASAVDVSKLGDNRLAAAVVLEILPAGAPDPAAVLPAAHDKRVAGTPGAPASDTVDSGSPASPATDINNAHLYKY